MARPSANRRGTDKKAPYRDSLDFRDWIYKPALISLHKSRVPRKAWIEIEHQGREGACTGFALAAVVNYLLRERDGDAAVRVSPRMLYEMAKHHDRWPGQDYEGSSARGAMKGWYKNGVCPEEAWPYEISDPGELTPAAREQALAHPLGAFYRVLPRRADLHAALNEVQAVFATAATHTGWTEPKDGVIRFESRWKPQGGHAFAIVGYTEEGFLIQNSWGEDWGGVRLGRTYFPGCAIWQYQDFDRNLWDAWVARLGRPYESLEALSFSAGRREEYTSISTPAEKPAPRAVIADHFVHIDDGQFDPRGDYSTSEAQARDLVRRAIHGNADHLLLYAHGGLNRVKGAAMRVHQWMPVFARNKIHEIHLIWETGLLAELRDLLLGKQDFASSRAGGSPEWFDSWIERVSGPVGRGLWKEMTTDAAIAFQNSQAAGRVLLETMLEELGNLPESSRPRLHLAGHSAGSLLLGHLLNDWRNLQASATEPVAFESLTLFAPACTHPFFESFLKSAMQSRHVGALYHFHLDDEAENNDNVATIYRKSLLYLVSRAYQKKHEVVPLMGMARYLDRLPVDGVISRVHHYDNVKNPGKTTSASHGHFDNDVPTMNSLLEIILGRPPAESRRFTGDDLSGY
jgi:hypothetical protein